MVVPQTHPQAGKINVACRFFAQGHCMRGQACWYKHVLPSSIEGSALQHETSGSSTTSSPGLSPGAAAFTARSAFTASPASAATSLQTPLDVPIASTSALPEVEPKEDEEDHICIICFEPPTVFGILESCSHTYCLACIREWRTQKGKTAEQIDSDVLKRCPACRAISLQVYPSNIWYTNAPSKSDFIADYKSRQASIPCRHFNKPNADIRFCPFGKDCFYAHLNEDGTQHTFEHGISDHIEQLRRRREQRHLESHLRAFYSRWRAGDLDGPMRFFVDPDEWYDSEDEDDDGDYYYDAGQYMPSDEDDYAETDDAEESEEDLDEEEEDIDEDQSPPYSDDEDNEEFRAALAVAIERSLREERVAQVHEAVLFRPAAAAPQDPPRASSLVAEVTRPAASVTRNQPQRERRHSPYGRPRPSETDHSTLANSRLLEQYLHDQANPSSEIEVEPPLPRAHWYHTSTTTQTDGTEGSEGLHEEGTSDDRSITIEDVWAQTFGAPAATNSRAIQNDRGRDGRLRIRIPELARTREGDYEHLRVAPEPRDDDRHLRIRIPEMRRTREGDYA